MDSRDDMLEAFARLRGVVLDEERRKTLDIVREMDELGQLAIEAWDVGVPCPFFMVTIHAHGPGNERFSTEVKLARKPDEPELDALAQEARARLSTLIGAPAVASGVRLEAVYDPRDWGC